MSWRAPARTWIGLVCIIGGAAEASERLDHRGSVGLLLAGGVETADRILGLKFEDYAGRLAGILGGTMAVGANGNELELFAMATRRTGASPSWSLSGGYRGYFGEEQFKTFFELNGQMDLAPAFAIGPRIGFGVQYDFASVIGVFAAVAAHLGIGNGGLFSGDALLGVQVRSYLLE